MDVPEISITSSISNKNFFSGKAKTIFLEKIEPTKTQPPINKPWIIAVAFKNPNWWKVMPLVNKIDRVLAASVPKKAPLLKPNAKKNGVLIAPVVATMPVR